MRRSLRLGTLFLLCGVAAAALAAAVIYGVGRAAVEAALAGALPPARIGAVSGALGGAVIAAALAALLLVVPVSVWISGFARRPLAELRAAFGRRDAALQRRPGIVEVTALAASLGRLLDEHRRALAPLLQERDELALLIDSVGEGILQVGADGRVIRANRTAREMLGLPDRAAAQPVSALVRHADLRAMLDAARRGEALEPAEFALDSRRILVVTHPLGARGGESAGAVAVLVDLTQLRRLEVVRRDFVANASHELKTPLTVIRGYAETLLGEGDVPAEVQRQFIETIRLNADRLQRIVDDLLDLSRLESGAWKPDLDELDVAGIARDAWEGLRHRAEAKEIAFAVESGSDIAVLADALAVRQILTNLLDNAIRHTPAGGRIAVRIAASGGHPRANGHGRAAGPGAAAVQGAALAPYPAVRPAADDAARPWVVTEVEDTGSGIPRDALGRVFERFYRVDPARSRAEGGTGLGLAIVKHLVQSMGGDVVVDSELGKGSTFRFWLPAAPAVPAVPAVPAGRPAGADRPA